MTKLILPNRQLVKAPEAKLATPSRRTFLKGVGAVAAASLITSPAIIRRAEAALMRGGFQQPSGFSDTDWPTTLNRPFMTGSTTKTLHWVGPVGGGPNDGNPQAQSLVLSNSGSVTTSSTNQVISGLNITGQVDIGHNGVTLKNCGITQSFGGAGRAVGLTKASITGVTIEDCWIDGSSDTLSGIVTVSGSSFVSTAASAIRRNTLTGFENHITLWCPGSMNLSATDNYFVLCANPADVGPPGFDGDMIELYQCSGVLVQHNQFDGTGSQVFNAAFNSMINVSNLGAVSATINNNLFSNVSTINSFILCQGPDFNGFAAVWAWTNNGYYNPGLTNSLPISQQQGGSTHVTFMRNPFVSPYSMSANSGNYYSATPLGTSGILINGGTGQIS